MKGTEKSGRRMYAEISQGRAKALPATQNASQKSSGGGQKQGSWGTKFKFGQLIITKIIKIKIVATADVIF